MHLLFFGFYLLIYITHYGALFFHMTVDLACDPVEAWLFSVKFLCKQLFQSWVQMSITAAHFMQLYMSLLNIFFFCSKENIFILKL